MTISVRRLVALVGLWSLGLLAAVVSMAPPAAAAADPVLTLSGPTSYSPGSRVSLDLEVSPAVSGTATWYYRKDGGAWTKWSKTISISDGEATHSGVPSGATEYFFTINGEVSNVLRLVASTASTGPTLTLDGPTEYTPGSKVTLGLDADPAVSGAAQWHYRKDGGAWKTWSKTISLSDGSASHRASPSGVTEYYFSLNGSVSNILTLTPVVPTLTLDGPTEYTPGTKVNLTLDVDPAMSGSASWYYRKDGGSWKKWSKTISISGGTATHSSSPSGVTQYYFTIGGVRSNTLTLNPVVPTLTLSGPTEYTPGTSVNLTLAADPAISGAASWYYRKNGGSWQKWSKTIAVSDGTATHKASPSGLTEYYFAIGGAKSNVLTLTADSAVPSAFRISGSGWGHGVGMSQYGAAGMASEGYDDAEILGHYYTGAEVERLPLDLVGSDDPDGDERMFVQVYGSSSDSANSVVLKVHSDGDGDFQVTLRDSSFAQIYDDGVPRTLTGDKNDSIRIDRSGSSISVTVDGVTKTGARAYIEWASTTYFEPDSTEDAYVDILTTSGGQATHGDYRHGFMRVSVLNSRLNITNILKLNTEYLYGIGEMPSSWPAAALQAQAIAARNYAVSDRTTSSSCDCYLYDDTRSQNFTGWKKENEGTNAQWGKKWVAAVDATTSSDGQSADFLTYSSGGLGHLVNAYYFSSSGGRTENSEDVWVATVSYLRAVSDPWSTDGSFSNPNASWTATISQSQAKSISGLSDVVKIEIKSRTSSNSKSAVDKVVFTSSSGATYTINGAEDVRTKMGLKSAWLWDIEGV